MRAIGHFQFASEGVGEELLDEAAGEGGLAFQERGLNSMMSLNAWPPKLPVVSMGVY